MNILVSDGLDIVSIGYNSLGSYYKLKRPVSILWNDCSGSIGQYLSLIPSSPEERELLQSKINANLNKDFTGREEELYELLKPLFKLFQNGEYLLSFMSSNIKNNPTSGSRTDGVTDETKWHTIYPEPVELARAKEIKRKYSLERPNEELQHLPDDLVTYTSTSIYGWENGFNIATRPKSQIDPKRVEFFVEKIRSGDRPFIIIMDALYAPEHDYSGTFILDGHHKLEAYIKLNIDPPIAIITRKVNSVTELEFDIESLGLLLYPWQIRHILDNWEEKNSQLPKLMQVPNNRLFEFVRHGHYKEYHFNGNLKHEGNYVYDNPEGLVKEYFESGNPKFEERYKDGLCVGIWKSWYSNGQLKSEWSYNYTGQLDGEGVTYRENGQIQAKNNYVNGVRADGYSFINYGHTGKLDFEFWHKDGKLVEQKSYSDNGGLIRHEVFSNELNRLIEIPISEELKYPNLLKLRSENKSFWGVREVLILIAMIVLILLKCFS